ncbi:MAG: S41 family peptidase [Fimbriiglobus sp.]
MLAFLASLSLLVYQPIPDDLNESQRFVIAMTGFVENVALLTQGEFTHNDLYTAALEELANAAAIRFSESWRADLQKASRSELPNVVQRVRKQMGTIEGMDVAKSILVALEGVCKRVDPYSGLAISSSTMIGAPNSLYPGFELADCDQRTMILSSLRNQLGSGIKNPLPPPGLRWQITRVVPGSPASEAGLKPGDIIRAVDDQEITTETATRLFQKFSVFSPVFDVEELPGLRPEFMKLSIRRQAVELAIKMELRPFLPATIFGVRKQDSENWDHLIDTKTKLGYIRITGIEEITGQRFRQILETLLRQNCRGLILDLRWCPGGYLTPSINMAGALLGKDKEITTITSRRNFSEPTQKHLSPGTWDERLTTLPTIILIGPETTGGGEMLAAAFQDHQRAILVGSRTQGKATISNFSSVGMANGIGLRITTGYSSRPSGINRQRWPSSSLTDPWGVRPSKGYEFPLTDEMSRKLRERYEAVANRDVSSREALDADDLQHDPQLIWATKQLQALSENRPAR